MALVAVIMLLTTASAWADNVTLSVDNDFAEGTAGHYYVNMPATGTNTLTLTDASITTFKVYDDGGKSGNYSANCEGFLVINAPEGYYLQLTGCIIDCSTCYFNIWEGSNIEESDGLLASGTWAQNASVNATSGNKSIFFAFNSENSEGKQGFDITVTLVDAPEHDIAFASVANGSATATIGGAVVTKAREGETVTVTGTPDGGYLLADVSVKDGNNNDVAVTLSPWTNSATFTMPTGDVTVTPTFAASEGFGITMPVTGTKRLAIPDGVTSFKVYDDGGPDGDYSPNCNGELVINLPEGYKFALSGTVTTDAGTGDNLNVRQGVIYTGTWALYKERSSTVDTPKEIPYNYYDDTMTIQFVSDGEGCYAGLDLTVTLIRSEHDITVNNADNVGGSVVTASVGGTSVTKAISGQTVTLTAAPAEGYVLGALSVRDADGNMVELTVPDGKYVIVSDMLWYTGENTANFTMPNSDITVTPVFTNVMTAEGGLTINMPKGIYFATHSSATKYLKKDVTIPSGVTSFKVYDYGGADCNYSDNYSGKLQLTAPQGCVLQLSGTITTQSGSDYLYVYDGTFEEQIDCLLNHVSSSSDGIATAIPTVVSTEQSISIEFDSDDAVNYAGLDLTVTVITGGTDYSVTVSNADTSKGTMTASTTTAQLSETVTLTATPADGCVLSGLSVTSGGRAVKTNWNVWTNSATFKMPNGDVTVTPTFTNDLGSLAVNLPATGNNFATIPEGVKSVKIYDDGGPDGNYTAYCNGGLGLTVPEGSLLRFTGRVAGPEDKFILGIAGNDIATANKNDIDVTSTNNNPRINFRVSGYETTNKYILYSNTGEGLDLTATVLYAVGVPASIANGTVTTDKTHAAADETVTLTVTPDADCTIGSVSVNGQPLEAVGGVYSFTMPAKNVTVGATFRKLLSHTDIAVADIPAQKYNGTALTPDVTVTDGTTELTQGTDYTISPETATDAGDYTVTITGIGNYDGTTTKTFTVNRRAVTLTSATESRAYDGNALTADGVTVSGDGFAEGEGATYTVTGQQTGAGSSANTFTYALNDGTKAANYDITTVEGTLTVTALTGITVTITGHTESTPYDGTEHTISGYDVEIPSLLYTEDDFTFSGTAEASRTDAGTTGMGLAADQFENTSANFSGVTFSVTDGGVTVTQKAVTVTADDKEKEYGQADPTLTATVEGLVGSDAVTYTVSREAGEAVGTYAITPTGDASQGNYTVTYVAGTMTITSNPTLNLVANEHDGNYWTTFYCGDAGYRIDDGENAWAYTAEYTRDETTQPVTETLTLHKLGKVIPKQTAVVIVGDDNSISMTASDASAENNVSNSLHGVDVRTSTADIKTTLGDGTFYVMGKQNGDFGFFEYTAQYMPARKAYLLVNGGAALAPGLKMTFDDETTSLTPVPSPRGEGSEYFYTLDGRKLDGKPAKSGVYVANGRKVVIK